jgi:hypothetical protein
MALTLKEQVTGWVDACRAANIPLSEYACPYCAATNYSSLPPLGEVYSTAARCPECARLHLRFTHPTGRVMAHREQEPRMGVSHGGHTYASVDQVPRDGQPITGIRRME